MEVGSTRCHTHDKFYQAQLPLLFRATLPKGQGALGRG